MRKTWEEMYGYLKKQDNCRVNGQGFRVINLYEFLEKMDFLINQHDPKTRCKIMYCQTLKGTLEMVYDAYNTGNIEPANTRHYRPNSTFGG